MALTEAAEAAGIGLRTAAGPPLETLAHAAAAEDVVAVVVGARGAPTSEHPAGSTSLGLISMLPKPVVVVPFDVAPGWQVENLLVPLDGIQPNPALMDDVVERAYKAGAAVSVAHVQQVQSAPPFDDHPPHEVDAWSAEFIVRHLPSASDATLEVRSGASHDQMLDILRRGHFDLVLIAWSQSLADGHAAVVRRLLAESPVPVLLAPTSMTTEPLRRSPSHSQAPLGGSRMPAN